MHKIRNQYPILKNYTYLNTANHGLISQELIDFRVNELHKMQEQASGYTDGRNDFIETVRATIARFIDADIEEIALITGFSMGFNMLLEGVDKNSSFLLLRGDYPSVCWPVESRGFECFYTDLSATLEDDILKSCEQHRPDFFCFSLVQFITGIKLDLDFIVRLKNQFPDMVIIADLTQYVGCEELRFRESGIDIILASCYKWLNAGDGNGFMCIKKAVRHKIKSDYIGYRSTNNVMGITPEFMGRFEPGHQDMTAFGSLKFAIEQVETIGIKNIENNLNAWSIRLKEVFTERHLLDDTILQRKHHSTIFNIKGDGQIHQQMMDRKIVTSLRGNGIRVSFSYYNNEDDLEKLLEVLDL